MEMPGEEASWGVAIYTYKWRISFYSRFQKFSKTIYAVQAIYCFTCSLVTGPSRLNTKRQRAGWVSQEGH